MFDFFLFFSLSFILLALAKRKILSSFCFFTPFWMEDDANDDYMREMALRRDGRGKESSSFISVEDFR
jgi:hypothetical protein